MADTFDIQITGLTEALQLFDGIKQRSGDLRPVGTTIGLLIQSDVDERFNSAPGTESGGSVYGGLSWAALSEAYLKSRPDRRGGQILRDTGELLSSFTIGGRGNVFRPDSNSVTFGSALPKARGLNKKRPMLAVHPPLVDAVARAILAYIAEGKV